MRVAGLGMHRLRGVEVGGKRTCVVGGEPRSQFIYISRLLMARVAGRVFSTGRFDGLTILHKCYLPIYGNSDSQPEGFPSFVGGAATDPPAPSVRFPYLVSEPITAGSRFSDSARPARRTGCMQCNPTAGDGLTGHRIGRARFERRPDVTEPKCSARFEMKWIWGRVTCMGFCLDPP